MEKAKEKRQQGGVSSSEVIQSAYIGDNSELFANILSLHVPKGSKIADVTFGKGVFWKDVDCCNYEIIGSDIKLKPDLQKKFSGIKLFDSVDFRSLPYEASSLDCVVFDPPYMEGFYRQEQSEKAGQGSHKSFQVAYSGGTEGVFFEEKPRGRLSWQDRVTDAYVSGAIEAKRVLKEEGFFIVKCQDAVSANIQRLTHVELITSFETLGFYTKDLFVLVRSAKASMSRVKTQRHARKNHSYFLIFQKPKKQILFSCRKCRIDRTFP
jgi:hypothetical protein